MSDDLVKRWDEYVESMGCVMGEVEHMAQQMRDRIDAQAAEIERLRGARDEFEAMAMRAATIAQEQRARAEKALKRSEILVEAWDRCDDASFRHLMVLLRADVAEAKVDKP